MKRDFFVRKDDLSVCRCEESTEPTAADLKDGEALLRIDSFAMTANNITYGVMGESMNYWGFFPAPEGWGVVPVWGFADVIASKHDDVNEGERLWGYYPMSTHLIIQPGNANAFTLVDVRPSRQGPSPAYNSYTRCASDATYDPALEDQQALVKQLFLTGMIAETWLADRDYFRAGQVIVASASSKTAFSTAWMIKRKMGNKIKVTGLTSSAHRDFVAGMDCYDDVHTYDSIGALDNKTPAVLIDISGNGEVVADVHAHMGDALKGSTRIGFTHWQGDADLPAAVAAKQTTFNTFEQFATVSNRLGMEGFQAEVAGNWSDFLKPLSDWITVHHGHGPAETEKTYLDVLQNRVSPKDAFMLSLHDA